MSLDVPSCGVEPASPPMTPVSPTEEKPTGETASDEGGSTEVVTPAAESEDLPVKIRYTVDCNYEDGPDFRVSKNDKPLDIQDKKDDKEGSSTAGIPVIELITYMGVADIVKRRASETSDTPPEEEPPATLENKRVKWVGQEFLRIHSAILSELLRDVVQFYPSQNLSGDTITIKEPYKVLAHHDKQLQARLAELEASDESTELEHLRILMGFVEQRVRPKYIAVANKMKQKKPTVTFEDVWYLLKPGQMAYAKYEGVWLGCQIKSVSPSDDGEPNLSVCVWFMDYWWRGSTVGATEINITIVGFEGERTITDLLVYPCEYFDEEDEGKRRAQFVKRGETMRDILWKGHGYRHHDGPRADNTKLLVKDLIVVGRADNMDFTLPENAWGTDWAPDTEYPRGEPPTVSPTASTTSQETVPLPYALLLDTSKHSDTYLTKDLLFMMCPIHPAFVPNTKTWIIINIDNTTELKALEVVPKAVVDPEKEAIIMALSDHQSQGATKSWSADYIKNKGDGVIILLHGPPGVGKTYTVETTAMRTGRPLISLAIAEIGTEEEGMEAELTKWFSLAEQWNAILLIDECDIFLERRNFNNIKRNGVVAAFLRKVEYYSGLLFLTTNRIGLIDEAFMSRVHAVVGFNPLDRDSRKLIWSNLLNKLSEERESIAITKGVVDYLESEEILNLPWNGREIRNAFQTAVILAEHQAKNNKFHKPGQPVPLEDNPFRTVVKMNQNFREYLEGVDDQNEVERAKMVSRRNDSYHK